MGKLRMLFIVCCLMACFGVVRGQKSWSTGNATIRFVSAKNSHVAAVNNQVSASISQAGDMNFRLLIRGFKFAMGEMEEHFNKEYLESDKYPHAWFKGKLQDAGAIDLTKAGVYKVQAQGELVIHNVARQVTVAGSLQVDRSSITLRAKFQLNIEDYKIETGLGGIIIGDRMNVEVVAKCQ